MATVKDVMSFFIHLGGADDPEDHNVVFSAFLNYEQIPLIVNRQPYLPLYLSREAKTWQFIPVSVQLPDVPGDYEFILVEREYPHSYFEINGEYVGKAFTEFSQRIRVSIHP